MITSMSQLNLTHEIRSSSTKYNPVFLFRNVNRRRGNNYLLCNQGGQFLASAIRDT